MIQKFNPFVYNDYPTTDARIMPETDWHRDLMLQLIETLKAHYAADPNVYVSGDLLVHYRPNDKRRHVSPDVFMVRGVPKGSRPNYLVWEEGRAPEVVIELSSKTTYRTDTSTKLALYRDVLKVKEYFLFDLFEEHLEPSMQGYRLTGGEYRPIRAKDGRLASRILGLQLERDGHELRFWDPATGRRVPTPAEQVDDERQRADDERQRADDERQRADDERRRADAATEEVARLRALLTQRDRHTNGKNGH